MDGVLNRRIHIAATKAFVGDSIDKKAIEVLAQPIYYRAVPVLEIHTANINRAWIKTDQVIDVSAIQRKI